MSNFPSYPTRSFSETQKFFVLDPQTGTPSFVLGSDLVNFLTPGTSFVFSESTRVSAQASNYKVGNLIQTAGAVTEGDGLASGFLVVPGGEGDFAMQNGNDLLVIRGDDLLREQLKEGVVRMPDLAAMESTPGRFDGDAARLVSGTGRDGDFRWDSSDLSATLVLASATSDSVDDTTDTINDADHPFSDGDGVITQTTVNGLTAQTVYWVVNSTSGSYQLSATFGGGAIDLTGTTNVTIDHLLDPLQGIYVTPSSDKTGASGAWVRKYGEVTPKMYGASGDAAADDTPAVHAAFFMAIRMKSAVWFTEGVYRVTSGYINNVSQGDLAIRGVSSSREADPGASGSLRLAGSTILLDSADAGSFFYRQAANHHLQVRDMTFACNQFVQDRSFFEWTAGGALHTFENVDFESVEKPLVYKVGTYFQSSKLSHVQFRKSGTIHSEIDDVGSDDLRGTLLVLDNVHHESTVPANSEKIVCNLSGIRQVQGLNFLLEGAGPGSDWTVLRLDSQDSNVWTREPHITLHGFWIEFSGSAAEMPAINIHQSRGRVKIQSPNFFISSGKKYKIDQQGVVDIETAAFFGIDEDLSTAFDLEDNLCLVNFYSCFARNFGEARWKTNYSLINCTEAANGSVSDKLGTSYSTIGAQKLWEFDGGFVDPQKISLFLISGTTAWPSTDPVYGRKFLVRPSGDELNVIFSANTSDVHEKGQQISVAVRFKFPTFTDGLFQIVNTRSNAVVGVEESFDESFSGQEIIYVYPWASIHDGAVDPGGLGFGIRAINATGVSGDLEIYHCAIYSGKSSPHTTFPNYPKNVVTYDSAAPTQGGWKAGDIVYNTAPSAGGQVGWVCTATGTPGTWKTFGAISA